ncbi:MAG: amino acid adenylation domain-containing protein, partial [bacterium]|nr:amino acid adenylation domain-containing protein [bacterium]
QEEYWLNRFNENIPILNLPSDYTQSAPEGESGAVDILLNEELKAEINRRTVDTGTTLFMQLMAVFNILLSKYAALDDIIIGVPVLGRSHPDLHNVIGMFVNMLAMRNFPSGNKTWRHFLEEVKESSLNAYQNQDYQFEQLIWELDKRNSNGARLNINIMFVSENVDLVSGGNQQIDLPGLVIKPFEFDPGITKFDLTLMTVETETGILLRFEYSGKLFKKQTITRMAAHFKNILVEVMETPHIEVSQIEMLGEEERNRLVHGFNNTDVPDAGDKTIHQLFERQVESTPDNIALVDKSCSRFITYKELDEKADHLARHLILKGVKSNSLVGLLLDRSFEMIIGILGILKAGGAYIPLDPTYPKSRNRGILEDCNAGLLVTTTALFAGLNYEMEATFMDRDDVYQSSAPAVGYHRSPDNPAYIIYTSGTTGKPKGVIVTHRNVVAYMNAFYRIVEITSKDIVIQQASYSFDAFVEEVYSILFRGGKVVIPGKYEVMDVQLLYDIILKTGVTIVDCSPLLLNQLNKIIETDRTRTPLPVRTFISGGDVLKREYVDGLIKTGTVYNSYGPTEATVCATFYRCSGEEASNVPIGSPISNYQLYIVDKNTKLLPIGIPGELTISGAGIARGYLNRVEATHEAFLQNPFVKNKRLYRTGDLCRRLGDGNIEFLGRIDQQVKIRGFRIETGEIENHLKEIRQIEEVIVLVKNNEAGDKVLCAYYISPETLTIANLRAHLTAELPDHMVPSFFMQLEKFPLTINGKTDLEALPAPIIKSEVTYRAPGNGTQERLASLWSKVLAIGIDKVGLDDNFFHLGGHSLKATALASAIHKEFDVKVSLMEIFKIPTLKEFSDTIAG